MFHGAISSGQEKYLRHMLELCFSMGTRQLVAGHVAVGPCKGAAGLGDHPGSHHRIVPLEEDLTEGYTAGSGSLRVAARRTEVVARRELHDRWVPVVAGCGRTLHHTAGQAVHLEEAGNYRAEERLIQAVDTAEVCVGTGVDSVAVSGTIGRCLGEEQNHQTTLEVDTLEPALSSRRSSLSWSNRSSDHCLRDLACPRTCSSRLP